MTETNFFFDGWEPLVRIVVVGVVMYVALVLLLRISGSRTLATMNAFDFIVTVAIGSVFGRVLTARDIALAEAIVAFVLLVGLQYAVGWAGTRWSGFRQVVTNPPALLYFRGEFLREAMREHRVAEDELLEAVRREGIGSIEHVEAIVLESNGEVSVIDSVDDGSALEVMTRDRPDDRPGDG